MHAGSTPILQKDAPRMKGQMNCFHVCMYIYLYIYIYNAVYVYGSHQFRESLRELLRVVVSYGSSREMPFREWNSENIRESLSELRELLREYPGTLGELRECQRAENGALDPWSLDLRFWGAPIFSPFWGPFFLKGFAAIWSKNLGYPKRRSNDHAPFSAL